MRMDFTFSREHEVIRTVWNIILWNLKKQLVNQTPLSNKRLKIKDLKIKSNSTNNYSVCEKEYQLLLNWKEKTLHGKIQKTGKKIT